MEAAPIALTVASAGLQTAGGIAQAQGTSAGLAAQEAKAARLAYNTKTAAMQTDAKLRNDLQETLGNIAVITAASGVDPSSPTRIAYAARETEIADRARRTQVRNLRTQAAQYADDAEFYGSAAENALGLGTIGAFASGLNRLSDGAWNYYRRPG